MRRTYLVWVGGILDIETTDYEKAKEVFYENLADGYLDAKLCNNSGKIILEWL